MAEIEVHSVAAAMAREILIIREHPWFARAVDRFFYKDSRAEFACFARFMIKL